MNGRVAFITGAAVGIGRATALKMAEEGADVALLDVDEGKLSSVVEEVKSYGVRAAAYVCDVSDTDKVNATVQDVLQTFGKIDILVNNAALWRAYAPFTEMPDETWKTYLDINVMGVVYCTKAVLPKMIENGYGRIVNVASVAGVYGIANMVAYSATKGALIAMTKALAKEVTGKGVTVNSVSPGTVSPSDNADVEHFIPSDMCYAGRTGTDKENAELICFLASQNAGYISGENIQIDGCRKKI